MKLIDLTGKRFGRLTVLRQAPSRTIITLHPNGEKTYCVKTYWLCRCDCGTEKEIESQSLRIGNTRSCGCLRREAHRAKA